MLMFWSFKLSFVVDILAFFDLATFLGYSLINLAFFFLSSGHPDQGQAVSPNNNFQKKKEFYFSKHLCKQDLSESLS